MNAIKKLRKIFFVFLMLISVVCDCQSLRLPSERDKYLYKVDSLLKIDYRFRTEADTVIHIHFRSFVFELYKSIDSLCVNQYLMIDKFTSQYIDWNSKYKTIFKKELLYRGLFNENDTIKKYFQLFSNLKNATIGKYLLPDSFDKKNKANMNELYVEVYSKKNISLQECPRIYLGAIDYYGISLIEILNNLIKEYKTWNRLEKIVELNGPGIYRFSKFDPYFVFKFTNNKTFVFKATGTAKISSKMPTIQY